VAWRCFNVEDEHPVIKELEKLEGEFQTVIDIGCSDGNLLLQTVEKFSVNGVGVDKNSSRISSAQSKTAEAGLADTLSFFTQKAEKLDFAGESFDVTISCFCVHELDDQVCGLREICRVLKKGGSFICLDWTKGANVSPGQHTLSPEEMEELCKEASFREVSVEYLDERRILCVARRK